MPYELRLTTRMISRSLTKAFTKESWTKHVKPILDKHDVELVYSFDNVRIYLVHIDQQGMWVMNRELHSAYQKVTKERRHMFHCHGPMNRPN